MQSNNCFAMNTMIMMRQTRSVLRSVQLRITHSQTELSSVFDGCVVVVVGWVAITERLAEDAVVHEDFYPKKRKRRKSVERPILKKFL